MTEIVQANHIVHGKEDLDRQTVEELTGPRRDEYAAALKDAGVTRQAVWHQQMPGGGTLSILYIGATDPDAHRRFLSSDSEVSRFWRQRAEEVWGRDVTLPPLPVELVHDFRV